ncbi:PepSY domain-containing protein [Sphingomonas sp. NPDC079357]|uniref:PepSY domain-containing protein n=1 Tax=Sphingomonas sp. NPDC079357 TaxID=3364518 RepID=UPI00384F0533
MFVRCVHLWLGLSLGLLFAALGLTGSALVFYTGIDAALHPVVEARPGDLPPGLASPAWDRALATGRARWHHPGDKWTLEVTGEGGPVPARYYPASGHRHTGSRRCTIRVRSQVPGDPHRRFPGSYVFVDQFSRPSG